jgi:hypothetical protein
MKLWNMKLLDYNSVLLLNCLKSRKKNLHFKSIIKKNRKHLSLFYSFFYEEEENIAHKKWKTSICFLKDYTWKLKKKRVKQKTYTFKHKRVCVCVCVYVYLRAILICKAIKYFFYLRRELICCYLIIYYVLYVCVVL